VRTSGLAWTILRPNTFMQNYASGPAFDGLRTRRAILEPAGAGRSAFVDVRDIAAVAAAVLVAPDGEHAVRHAGAPTCSPGRRPSTGWRWRPRSRPRWASR
jgi:uncharacterized protein YbjT (DUF2867 family)